MAQSRFDGSSVGGDRVCAWSGAVQDELHRRDSPANTPVAAAPPGRRGCYCDLGDLETVAVEQRRRYLTLTCSGGVRDCHFLLHPTHSAIIRFSSPAEHDRSVEAHSPRWNRLGQPLCWWL